MDQIYIITRDVALYGTGIAAIASGYRIYVKWNRGEAVIALIFNWMLSMIVATILMTMVYSIILNKDFVNYTPTSSAISFARELHSASIIIGLIMAVVATIHIYYKYNSGEDVTELVYRWVASLFFLFTFGLIIETFL